MHNRNSDYNVPWIYSYGINCILKNPLISFVFLSLLLSKISLGEFLCLLSKSFEAEGVVQEREVFGHNCAVAFGLSQQISESQRSKLNNFT